MARNDKAETSLNAVSTPWKMHVWALEAKLKHFQYDFRCDLQASRKHVELGRNGKNLRNTLPERTWNRLLTLPRPRNLPEIGTNLEPVSEHDLHQTCARHPLPTSPEHSPNLRNEPARTWTGTPRNLPRNLRQALPQSAPNLISRYDPRAHSARCWGTRRRNLFLVRSPRWPRLSWQLLTPCPFQHCRAS